MGQSRSSAGCSTARNYWAAPSATISNGAKMLDRPSAGWRHRSCTPSIAPVPPYGLIGRTSSAHRFGSQVSITDMLTRLRPVVGVVYLTGDHFGQKGATRLPPHESGDLRRRQ